MNNYVIEGNELPNFQIAVEQLQSVLGRLAEEANVFSLEAHFADLDAMRAVARLVRSERFACYCWKSIENGQSLLENELQNINHIRLSFGSRIIRVAPDLALPSYDWDGSPTESVLLTFSERFLEPVDKAQKEGSSAIAQTIGDIVTRHIGSGHHPVKMTTSMESTFREHLYIITVPRVMAASVASAICLTFDLHDGIGTFELLGSAATLEGLVREGRYGLTNFPSGCPSLNKTPFALERASFLAPVLNTTSAELGATAAVIDRLGIKVVRSILSRKYLSWRLAGETLSPKTQGNYALLSPQRTGFLMFIGFEQNASADPTPKQFIAEASSRLSDTGVKLKRVAYIK